MQALSQFETRAVRVAAVAAIGLLAIGLALVSRAAAGVAPSSCPAFRVLHADRIGPAVLPAGSYELKVESSGLTCKGTAGLLVRFLTDYDGKLPSPWRVVNEGAGKASFTRGKTSPGFSISLGEAGTGGTATNQALGALCPGTFTVESTTTVASLRFTKGKFLIYLPAGSRLSCKGSAALFSEFLGAGGTLPPGWRLMSQTATFFRPGLADRSVFRIESLGGAGPR